MTEKRRKDHQCIYRALLQLKIYFFNSLSASLDRSIHQLCNLYYLHKLIKCIMTPDRPTDRSTDISIYRAPMELKMRSKCRIQFGVLCSASSGAQDTNLDSAEYNLGSYAVQASAQDPKLYSAEYNLVSYAPELALQRTLNCILHFCIYSSLLLKFLILCGHHRWSTLFSRSHIHPTVKRCPKLRTFVYKT